MGMIHEKEHLELLIGSERSPWTPSPLLPGVHLCGAESLMKIVPQKELIGRVLLGMLEDK